MNSIANKQQSTLDDLWTVTFTDLLILLIAFFVLRYSMYTALFPVVEAPTTPIAENPQNKEQTVYQRLIGFLRLTTDYSDTVSGSALDLEFSTRFKGIASVTETPSGANIELSVDTVGTSIQGSSLSNLNLLASIATVLKDIGDVIIVRYKTPSINSGLSQIDSGWSIASAKAAVIVRQLVDAGIEKEKIFIEVVEENNPKNKGILTISVMENDKKLSQPSSLSDVLLNLNDGSPASESKITFLDL